jgi:hypothetical protein
MMLMAGVICAEDVTITTFYPALIGDYDELATKGKTTLVTDSTAIGKTFKYDNCTQTQCGPNYCCCST